jgi:hypothetical protein
MKRKPLIGLALVLIVGVAVGFMSPGATKTPPSNSPPARTLSIEDMAELLESAVIPTPRTTEECPSGEHRQPLTDYDPLILQRGDLPWEAHGMAIDEDSFTSDATDEGNCLTGILQKTFYQLQMPGSNYSSDGGLVWVNLYTRPEFAHEDYTARMTSLRESMALTIDPPGTEIESTLGDARIVYQWPSGDTTLRLVRCRAVIVIAGPFTPTVVLEYGARLLHRLEPIACP